MRRASTMFNSAITSSQSANRIFKNAKKLISGKAIGGVLSLAYLAIAARTLGPKEMGYLVLAHAYVMVIAHVSRFQSWQAIIRFGAGMIADGETNRFKTLVRFTVKLDLLSAVFAVIISIALAGIVGQYLKWPPQAMPLIYIYCAAAPFLIAATPTGILRLFDEFKQLGWQLTVMPVTRFIGAALILLLGGGLNEFIAVWVLSAVLDGVGLWTLGTLALKKRGLIPAFKPKEGEKADPKWLGFMIKTNLTSSIELTYTFLPVLIVGSVLNSAASGFLQLATNLSNLIAHPADLLNQASYPELAKINNTKGKPAMRQVAWRSALTGLCVALPIVVLYFLLRHQLATYVGGIDFAPAAILIALMALVQACRLTAVVLESAVLSTGQAGYVLFAQFTGAVIGMGLMFFLLQMETLGVAGAPIAMVIGLLIVLGLCIYPLYRK